MANSLQTIFQDSEDFLSRTSGFHLDELSSLSKLIAQYRRRFSEIKISCEPVLLRILTLCELPFLWHSSQDAPHDAMKHLFSEFGYLFGDTTSDIQAGVLNAVNAHLLRSNQRVLRKAPHVPNYFIMNALYKSTFTASLYKSLANLGAAVPIALRILRQLLSEFAGAAKIVSDSGGLSTLCLDVSGTSVEQLIDIFVLFLSAQELDEQILTTSLNRKVLDFLVLYLPTELGRLKTLSPKKKMGLRKGVLFSILRLATLAFLHNAEMLEVFEEVHMKTLTDELLDLVNKERKSTDIDEVLSAILSILTCILSSKKTLSVLNGRKFLKVCLDIACNDFQSSSLRKHAFLCLCYILPRMMPEANKELADQIKRCLDCSFQDNQDPLRDSAFVEEKVMLCLSLSMTNDPEILKMLSDLGTIENTVNVLSQVNRSDINLLSNGLLTLTQLCAENAERCRRFGTNGSNMLMRILTGLLKYFSESVSRNDEFQSLIGYHQTGEPIKVDPDFSRLAVCAVEAVRWCILDSIENRMYFLQQGGYTQILSLLECAPLTLIGSIVRCLCVACQQDASVESALIAWRGARKPPKVGVDESIFSKDTTANDEIMLKLNEHRLGTQCLLGDVESDRNNLASILCHLWRCNMERLIGEINERQINWSPVQEPDEQFVLIYLILKKLGFEEHFELNTEDQITMVDIENYRGKKIDESISHIQDDLRESGLRPVSADRRQLQQAEEIAKIRGEGIRSKKMAILRAANDADAWLEAECCNLTRELSRRRALLKQRELDARLRDTSIAYLRASKANKHDAIAASMLTIQNEKSAHDLENTKQFLQIEQSCSEVECEEHMLE
uniref:Uso1_p115_head domain-containing protein n=1 Tax=Mesocestoides corti TaxID=53468 RepID=A0A5K3F011_MESCO